MRRQATVGLGFLLFSNPPLFVLLPKQSRVEHAHTHTYIHTHIYACIDREGGQAKALSFSKMWPKACLSADMPTISEEQFASCKEHRTAAPEDHCEFDQNKTPTRSAAAPPPCPPFFITQMLLLLAAGQRAVFVFS